MKKALKWIVGVPLGIVLILIVVGYLAGPQPKVDEKSASVSRLDRLKQILAEHDLSVCEVYEWIGEMEARTRKDVEAQYPDMNAVDRIQRIDQVRDKEWLEYREAHQLPDSLRWQVNGYGLEECK